MEPGLTTLDQIVVIYAVYVLEILVWRDARYLFLMSEAYAKQRKQYNQQRPISIERESITALHYYFALPVDFKNSVSSIIRDSYLMVTQSTRRIQQQIFYISRTHMYNNLRWNSFALLRSIFLTDSCPWGLEGKRAQRSWLSQWANQWPCFYWPRSLCWSSQSQSLFVSRDPPHLECFRISTTSKRASKTFE
jgi:hypothetical protein